MVPDTKVPVALVPDHPVRARGLSVAREFENTGWKVSGLLLSPFQLLISRNQISDLQKLTFISTIMCGLFLFTANYYYDPGAHLFLIYAEALVHGKNYLIANVGQSDIAYPLLLVISGYTLHHSFIPIAIMNAFMAIMMPSLIYLTVRPVFPRGSYYIALATIFSLTPFFYVKYVHHDHPYIFFNVLSVCFLSLFIYTKKDRYLYAMTLAVIVGSLVRPAGNIEFPLFLVLAAYFSRGNSLKYFICIVLALSSLFLYKYHRHLFFDQFGNTASVTGAQTFYNLYLNSKMYGIHLGPELGPSMKEIIDDLYQYKLTSGSRKPDMTPKLGKDMPFERFYRDSIYPKKPKEFVDEVFNTPSWDFWQIMTERSTRDDKLFMNASLEIVKRHPFYPLEFTLRNSWLMLYKPGFAFGRYDLNGFSQTGIQDVYTFNRYDVVRFEQMPQRALQEIQFDNLDKKPKWVNKFIVKLRNLYCEFYLGVMKLGLLLMAIAWSAVGINILRKLRRYSYLEDIAKLLPEEVTPITVSLTLYLFLNVAIISLFVDPMLRYHSHLLPFKIMLAGIGFCTLVHALLQKYKWQLPEIEIAENAILSTQTNKINIGLICLVAGILLAWAAYMIANT